MKPGPVIACYLLVFVSLSSYPQQNIFSTYTMKDGLVANPIRRIYQDSKGFIWIITWDGLSKYDGHKFTNFSRSNGLSHDLVNDIQEIDDRIYVAQNNGVIDVIQNDVLLPKPITKSLVVNKFHPVQGRKVLVTTDDNGICEFNNGQFHKPPQSRPRSTYNELVEINDSLLLSLEADLGTLQLHKGRLKLLAERKLQAVITCGYIDRTKRIWIGTAKGLKQLQPIKTHLPSIAVTPLPAQFDIPLLKNGYITALLETNNRDFWIATTQGLLRLRPDGSSYLFTRDDGLPSESINTIFEDREKNIWIGTSLGLAKIVTASHIEVYSTKNGLRSDRVFDVALLKSDKLVLTTAKGVQYCDLSIRRFVNIPGNDNFQYTYIRKTHPFLIHSGNIIGEFDSNRQQIIRKKVLPVFAYCVTADTSETYFSGTENGLIAYSGKIAQANKLLTFRTEALLLEENGLLWAGSWHKGLYRINYKLSGDKFDFSVTNLTPIIKAEQIRTLYQDSKGNIWVGTRYDGAFRLSKANEGGYEVLHIGQAEGLSSNWVCSFAEGKDGSVWIGTRIGIAKLIVRNNEFRVFDFSRANNFFGWITTIVPAAGKTIWCVADAKLVEFIDDKLETKGPLPVHITSIVFGAGNQKQLRLNPDTTISLNHFQNQLHFEFSAPSFINEKQRFYSYRLVGSHDASWSAPANEHSVSYASLKPGNYRFEVRNLGWNKEWGRVSYLSFSIKPPFWQTWWFVSLCILFIGWGFYAFYRYRINQLKNLQTVRNRIATDLHDDIGSTLSNISILSTLSNKNLNQPQQAAKYLERINEEVNISGKALDDIIWSINSSNDTLEAMLVRMRRFAAELFDSSNTRCKLELKDMVADRKMNMEQRRDVYLVYKETLNNIHKHANAQNILVKLELDNNVLTLTIKDDGKGFNPKLFTERNGLKNLKMRVEKWKGEILINSEPGAGTSIEVSMPVKG